MSARRYSYPFDLGQIDISWAVAVEQVFAYGMEIVLVQEGTEESYEVKFIPAGGGRFVYVMCQSAEPVQIWEVS